ncbi:MAG: type II secretion system protein [Minisyncoccia bacterium]
MNKKFLKGLSFVEVLIVVALIALLVGIVVSKVGAVRQKAANTKISATLDEVRVAARMYYDENRNYGVKTKSCSTGMFADVSSGMSKLVGVSANFQNGYPPVCGYNDSSAGGLTVGWAVHAYLNQVDSTVTNMSYCVDSTGYSGLLLTSHVAPALSKCVVSAATTVP